MNFSGSIVEASATGLFRTILIILLIYFLFRVLSRYVFPWMAKRWLRRFEKDFYERNPHIRNESERPPGDVSIDYVPPAEKTIPDEEGEYVDYQEINDKANEKH